MKCKYLQRPQVSKLPVLLSVEAGTQESSFASSLAPESRGGTLPSLLTILPKANAGSSSKNISDNVLRLNSGN